jgi:hypothetical protein
MLGRGPAQFTPGDHKHHRRITAPEGYVMGPPFATHNRSA